MKAFYKILVYHLTYTNYLNIFETSDFVYLQKNVFWYPNLFLGTKHRCVVPKHLFLVSTNLVLGPQHWFWVAKHRLLGIKHRFLDTTIRFGGAGHRFWGTKLIWKSTQNRDSFTWTVCFYVCITINIYIYMCM